MRQELEFLLFAFQLFGRYESRQNRGVYLCDKVKNILIATLGILVMVLGSFGGGYFYNKKTSMLFGDAKDAITKLITELKTYVLKNTFKKISNKNQQ